MAGVELAVGGWFASAVIGQVVGKARTYFGDIQELNGSTEEMLFRLETALPQIQSVIDLVEEHPIGSQIPSPGMRIWLRQLKDVAYEAEDVLDDLETKQLRHDIKGKKKVATSLKFVKHLFSSDDELKALKNTLKKLDILASSVGNFTHLLTHTLTNHEPIVRREETSLLSDEVLFGRDDEKEAILEMLLCSLDGKRKSDGKLDAGSSSSDLNLRVIPIVGIGGVGKTSLARLIYNIVEDQFNVKTWVYVADNIFDVKKITVQMLLNLVSCTSLLNDGAFEAGLQKRIYFETQSLEHIQAKLRDILKRARFFIILDDVWDDTGAFWEKLRSPLINETYGGVVLMTTQSKRTAEMIGTVEPIVMDVLDESEYCKLFEHFAFGDNKMIEETKRKELHSLCREIASKLQGLPLAGKVLGGLLKTNLDVDYWRRLLKSEWWEIDGLQRIIPSLRLSFQHLSANLRQCFAYCSIFPKGYIFEKERLVQMWMVQGFIQPDERKRWRMEDKGIEWFDELTSRAFFQPIWNDKFVMHDLMRELATYVSSEECFVLKDDSEGIPRGIRHLSLRTDRLDVLNKDNDKLKGLRTILFFGDYNSEFFVNVLERLFKQSRSLRALDVSCIRSAKGTLPNSIGGLSHLRYFDLSYTQFEYLPKTLSSLLHLQVLNLRGCRFSSLPNGISNLIKLRHLYASADTLSLIVGIGKLTCLPRIGGIPC